jgi:ABC-type multidrug transport system ATPase subunit
MSLYTSPVTPASTAPAIEITDVARIFGSFAALRRCSATIATGTITLLLGENGAGKSTLLRLIAGLGTPSRGSIRVFGEAPHLLRSRVAYVSHSTMLYDELTAMENLRYFATLQATGTHCACSSGSPEMALRAVGLDPHLTRPVGQFSQGMRQRTALARALQTDPDLLLLDEPFSNLDVAGVRQMIDLLLDFRTWPSKSSPTGRTILLTTHQATLVTPVADTILTLANGTFSLATPASLTA